MAAASYDEALRRVLVHEGGYSNHPSDPGGPTNFGITIADYRRYVKPDATAADVRAMSVDEAKAIYRKRYWDVQRCDELPAGVDYSVFDYGVNSGIGRSGKVLRRVVGLPDDTSVVTDQVLAYARVRDPKVLVAAICDERLAFLKSLRTWPVFGRGWGTRVAEVKAASLAMAGAAQGVTPSPAPASVAGTPPWLARMNAILGLYEFPGAADNPAIIGMAKACGGEIARTYRHDATPWCALAVNYCLVASGLPGDDSLWALDFARYGVAPERRCRRRHRDQDARRRRACLPRRWPDQGRSARRPRRQPARHGVRRGLRSLDHHRLHVAEGLSATRASRLRLAPDR